MTITITPEELDFGAGNSSAELDLSGLAQTLRQVQKPIKKEISPNDALDILEVVSVAEDVALASGKDISAVTDVPMLENQVRQGQDVVLQNNTVFAQHKAIILQDLEFDIRNGRDLETSVQAYQTIQAAGDTDTFFSDPVVAEQSRKERETTKVGEYYLEKLANGTFSEEDYAEASKAFDKQFKSDVITSEQSTLGVLTPEQAASKREGAFEQYMYNILFLPELVHGWFDEEAKQEWEAFTILMDEKAKRDQHYATGRRGGNVVSLVADPLMLVPAEKLVTIPAKVIANVSKEIKFISWLGEKLSPAVATTVAKLHDTSLIQWLKKLKVSDEQLAEQIIARSKTKSGRLSKAIEEASTRLDEEIMETAVRYRVPPVAEAAFKADIVGDAVATDYIKTALLNKETTLNEVLEKATGISQTTKPVALNPNIPVARGTTPYAANVEAATALRTVAEEIQYDVMQQIQKDTIRDIHHLAVDANRELRIGVDANAWRGQSSGIFKRNLLPPKFRFKGSALRDLVERPTGDLMEAMRFRSAFDKLHASVWKGLSPDDASTLTAAVRLADDLESHLYPVQGGLLVASTGRKIPASPAVVERYIRRRTLMNHAKNLLNVQEVKFANREGFRLLEGRMVRKVKQLEKEAIYIDNLGNEIARPEKLKDFHIYQELDDAFKADIPTYRVLADDVAEELPPTYNLVGGHKGDYLRIEYTDKYAITYLKRDSSGRVVQSGRTHTASTHREAKDFIDSLEVKEGEEYIIGKFNEDVTDLIYDGSTYARIKYMTEKQLADWQEDLRKAGVEEEIINAWGVAWDKYRRGKASPLQGRAADRLESVKGGKAPTAEPMLADARYLDWVASHTATKDTNIQLANQFWETYGSYLDTATPGNIFAAVKKEVPIKLKTEIKGYQEQLKQVMNQKSADELWADHARDYFLTTLREKDWPGVKTAYEILDDFMPTLSSAARFGKAFAANQMIGSLAIVQLPLQFSAAFLNTNGAMLGQLFFKAGRAGTAKLAAQLQTDFLGWLLPNTFKQFSFTKGGANTVQFIEKLGITKGFDYAELAELASDVRNMRKLSTGALGVLDEGKKLAGKLVTAGAYPLRKGEALGQVYGALAARRILEKQVKDGTHAFLTAADLVDGYSDEFMQEALSLGKEFALNMTKLNRPEVLQSAIGSTLLLFKEFGIQQGATMFAKSGRINRAQQWGMRLAWGSLFGIKGIPYAWDVLTLGEKAMNAAPSFLGDMPDSEGFLKYEVPSYGATWIANVLQEAGFNADATKILRWATQGLDAALTDGQIQLGTRAALGAFFSQALGNPSMDETTLGAVWSAFKQTALAERNAVETLIQGFKHEGTLTDETVKAATHQAIKPFAGVASMGQAVSAVNEGELRSRKRNRLLTNEPTLSDMLLTAAGITIGKAVGEYEAANFQRGVEQVFKDWVYTRTDYIAQIAVDNPELADALFEESKNELKDSHMYTAQRLEAFINGYLFSSRHKDIPLSEQKTMQNIRKSATERSIRSLIVGD